MGVGSTGLLSGWLVPCVCTVAALCLALALGWRTRRWRLSLAVLAAGAVGLLWLLNAVLGGSWIFQPSPPLYVCALAAIPVFVIASIPLGWRSASRRQRLFLVPAVALCTIAAAGLINQYYAYFPTLDSIFAQHPAHEISLTELRSHGYLGHHGRIVHAVTTPAGQAPSVQHPSTAPGSGGAVPAGRLLHVTIPGTRSGFRARAAWVYLPPVWFSDTRPQLPVVLLLNGTPGSPDDWTRRVEIQRTADAYAAAHGGWSPIFVAADENGSFTGDTECVDRKGAMADTYLAVDVRDYIIRSFDSAPDARHWAVEGFSEGGTCAITLALRHPDLFRTFVDTSGESGPSLGSASKTLHELFNGSTSAEQSYDPAALLRAGHGRGMGGWFEVGSSDKTYAHVNQALARLASTNGVAVQIKQLAGVHNFHVFRAGFVDSFAWLCGRLGPG